MDNVQIGGVGIRELAEEFGTPLYVYDETMIKSRMKEAVEAFSSDAFDTRIAYAS